MGNHAPPCHGPCVHNLENEKQYAGGDDIEIHVQRIADGIERGDDAVGDPSVFVSTTSSTTIDKSDPSQEAIERIIIDYVHMDARSDASCKPAAPLLFVHAGEGTGKSSMAVKS